MCRFCVRIRAGISVRVRIRVRNGVRISNRVRRRVKLVNYSLITALPIATSADPLIRFLPWPNRPTLKIVWHPLYGHYRLGLVVRVRLSVRNIEYITPCFTVTRYCVTSCNINVNLTVQMDTFRYKYVTDQVYTKLLLKHQFVPFFPKIYPFLGQIKLRPLLRQMRPFIPFPAVKTASKSVKQ